MACNRPDYLERTIQSVLKYHSEVASKFPLFISQDGTNEDVKSKALSYSQIKYLQVIDIASTMAAYFLFSIDFLLFIKHLDFRPVQTDRPGELIAYYKIANHYKWALDELFFKHNFSRVIILEDDMEIAPDFFDYFEAAATLLDNDKTIMAVSSWNDNGQVQFVHDSNILYRSDFFPGLGWMLTKITWDELSPKWPKAYPFISTELVDGIHYMASVYDENSRLNNLHLMRERSLIGSSMGQFFRQYLEPIKLNDVHVNWKSMDLSYLSEDNFRKYFAKLVSDAKPVHGPDLVLKTKNVDGDVRVLYDDQSDFDRIARQFGIFEEWKDGVPRTAYKGVVVFRFQTQRRVFLVAPESLRQLGI
ncbi:hypothetical protein Taro_049761 [Colocasia esculenta]|uniref:Alpha-1,3-mannosyl-glycoprotein 2-beta-N-acetylglucosaminyltransferase n=1 Tax=Colocasia esculenta TaxID=4460 RepID=A0A843XC03_COLES|nr:hypothetical protein [Colocasia esculenta]